METKLRAFRLTAMVRGVGIAMVVFMSVDLGCAGRCAEDAEFNYRSGKSSTYVYHQPMKRVWRELRQLGDEHGFKLADAKQVTDVTLYSQWKKTARGNFRWVVRFTSLDAKRFQVRLREQQKFEGEISDYRRLSAIEWALIERIDPRWAQKVELAVEKRGQRAFDSCSGCARCGSLWL